MKSEFQLVLEFGGDSPDNFERVLAVQEKLEERLKSGEVDGNDVGQGIVNIFIITNQPKKCFQEALKLIDASEPLPRAAAYRDLDHDNYVRVWPEGDETPFKLK
jgi:hypothetical protein